MTFPLTAGSIGAIQLESTATLAAEVQSAKVARPIVGLPHKTPIELPSRALRPLSTSGTQILTSIGVASNPFVHLDPLDPANLWAYFRYYWAFDTNRTQLCLHDRTKKIRFHHRTTLSEYLGLGIGILVAKQWLTRIFHRAA